MNGVRGYNSDAKMQEIDFPDEFSMEMLVNDKSLIINTSSNKIDTMINTIDEILRHIHLARKVINHD